MKYRWLVRESIPHNQLEGALNAIELSGYEVHTIIDAGGTSDSGQFVTVVAKKEIVKQ